MDTPLRVALVNDYEVIVEGVRRMLAPFGDRLQIVDTSVEGTPDVPVDVVLFDTYGSDVRALGRLREMAADREIGKVVLYTWDLPVAYLGVAGGVPVDGVILKSASASELVEGIERIVSEDQDAPEVRRRSEVEETLASLSAREREVLALLARGHPNAAIAAELYLSVDTVKTHVRRVFRKLGVGNRTQAALAVRSMLAEEQRVS